MTYKKHCKTLKEAERLQWRLYDKYETVICKKWPDGESGEYIFEVDKKII